MAEVTVIIPVYNAEKYVSDSIESVMRQTDPDWKLILVNDGSRDNSESICREYCEKDSRIHLFSQKNLGSFAAVGTGLNETDTEYVMFLDADDWYEPEMIETMHKAIREYNADTVLCGYRKIYPDGKEEIPLPIEDCVFEKDDIEARILEPFFEKDANIYRRWSAPRWDKIYRTELLKKTYFTGNPKATIGEDLEMNLRYLAECDRAVSLADRYLYCYRVIDQSLARGYSEKMRKQYDILYGSIAITAADQNRPFAAKPVFEDMGILNLLSELDNSRRISNFDKKLIRKVLISRIHDRKMLRKRILTKNFPGKSVLQKIYRKMKNRI